MLINKKTFYQLGLFFVFTTALFFYPSNAKALTLKPVKILITSQRGSTENIRVELINDSRDELILSPVILAAAQDEKGRTIFDKNLKENWINAEENYLILKPQEKKFLNFIINVPADAYPGSHYFGIGASSVGSQNQVGINGQLLSLLTLQVAGIANENLSLVSWQADKNIFFGKNWPLLLNIKNEGNVELPIFGKTFVLDNKNKEIFSQDLYYGNNLLASASRQVRVILPLEGRIKWPGIYRVKTQVEYGLTRQHKEKITSVFYLPYWSVAAGLILFFGVIYLLLRLFKRKK